MTELCQWRDSIGASWNTCQCKRVSTISESCYSLPFYDISISKGCPKLLVSIVCIAIFLLILSGDIETNPGPLDINDLSEVLDALRKHNFATASQRRPLCLKLGVSYNSLSVIEADHRDQTERQLSEGMSEWLRKRYDQKKYDPPSWKVLVNALKAINEIATAEGIERKKMTVAVSQTSRVAHASHNRGHTEVNNNISANVSNGHGVRHTMNNPGAVFNKWTRVFLCLSCFGTVVFAVWYFNIPCPNNNSFDDGKVSIMLPSIENVAVDFHYEIGHNLSKIYKMNTNPRGYCIIINIRKGRQGTDKDVERLTKLFHQQLKFEVREYPDLSSNEILELGKLIKEFNHEILSSFVMFILAHGNTINGDTFVKAADDKLVNVSEIEDHIKEGRGLTGKPKLLFIQACRGSESDSGVTYNEETDGIENEENDILVTIAKDSDFYKAHATTKGKVAIRDKKKGTIFIQHLVDIFERHAGKYDLHRLMTEVKHSVSANDQGHTISRQVSETTDTLLKTFYFGRPPPGVENVDFTDNGHNCKESGVHDKYENKEHSMNNSEMDKELSAENDMMNIMLDIEDITAHYKKLGLLLHLRPPDIETIERDNSKAWDAMYSVISEWLKWNFECSTDNCKYPTRKWLVKAIKEIDPKLADKIKKKYSKANL